MIPTIETIVEDLLAGKITKSQAISWLHQHAEDAGRCLRDDFAALALQGLLASYAHPQSPGIVRAESANFAQHAYQLADAMLAARAKAEAK